MRVTSFSTPQPYVEEKCQTPCEILVPVGDGEEHDILLKKEGYIDVERRWRPRTVVEDPPQLPPMAESRSTITVKSPK